MAKHVIVGNSAAGTAAAERIRRLDREAAITIVSDEPALCYSRCLTPEFVAGELSFHEMAYRSDDFYRQCRIGLLANTRAVALDPTRKRLTLAGGQELTYDKLLLATGARPAPLAVEGADRPGVLTLHGYADAECLVTLADAIDTVLIIGTGLVGLRAAEALRKRGIPKVVVIARRHRVLPRNLDADGASIVQQALEKMGVEFIFGVQPLAFRPARGKEDSQALTVVLSDGRDLQVDLVLSCGGTVPNAELLQEADGAVRQGIVVTPDMRTSLPDVYAAGDVIEIKDAVTGEWRRSGLWPLAVEAGHVAGANMAGHQETYDEAVTQQNATELGGVPIVSVGIAEEPGEGYRVVSHIDSRQQQYRRFVFQGDRLVGVVLVGDIAKAGLYQGLIKSRANAWPFAEKLLEGTFSYADVMAHSN